MKAYAVCPGCNTRNEPIWVMDKPNRMFHICLCTECQNMYYQLLREDVKSREIMLDFVNHVPYFTKIVDKSFQPYIKKGEVKLCQDTL